MTDWRDVKLGELGSVERGRSRHRPRNDPRLFGDDVPFFQTGDVKAATLHMSIPSQYYSDFGVAQSRVWEPGVACITIAANIADTAILGRRGCFPDSILGFTPTHQASDAYFIKYLLDFHKAQLTSAARGTTQDNLSLEKLMSHRFRVPDPVGRIRISGVLRAFDDLIENNQRRVELLGQMAQAIYREWFVNFRYPGHQDATLVDSSIGPVPEGWKVCPLSDLANIVRGRSYRREELLDSGGVPFINLKCMMRGGGFRRDGLKRYNGTHTSDQQVSQGDIVLAVTDLTQGREILARATLVPRLGEKFGVISLDVVRIVPKDPGDRLGLFFALRFSDFADRIKEFANGSTVLHLSPTHVTAGEVAWPVKSLRTRFTEIAAPMIVQMDDFLDAGDRLRAIRDLLLPRLLTGRIDLSSLDLDAGMESVA